MKQLAAQLELCNYRYLHIVIGMAKDKEIDHVLALLPQLATYYFTKAQLPRALDEQLLQQQAAAYQLIGKSYPTTHEALIAAKTNAHKEDLVLVCGSVFVVGEVI